MRSRARLNQVMPLDERTFTQAADGYLVRAVPMMGSVQAIDRCLARQCRHGANDSEFYADTQGLMRIFESRFDIRKMSWPRRMLAERFGLKARADLEDETPAIWAFEFSRWRLSRAPILCPMTRCTNCGAIAAFGGEGGAIGRVPEIGLAMAATLPRSVALPLVRWRHVRTARPSWLRALSLFRKS